MKRYEMLDDIVEVGKSVHGVGLVDREKGQLGLMMLFKRTHSGYIQGWHFVVLRPDHGARSPQLALPIT